MGSGDIKIGIVPMGEVPEITPKVVAANILAYLGLAADVLPRLDPPEEAFDPRRCQYDAAVTLKALEVVNYEGYEKVIGILAVDLFIPIFTFVFGEAKMGGSRALVSLFRLGRASAGPAPSSSLVYERAAKVALHELGHLFNLRHCPDGQCLMHFSGELKDLDAVPFFFCRYCHTYLKDAFAD